MLTDRGHGSLDQPSGGFGGDAEFVSDLTVGTTAPVVEAEALLDGATRPIVENRQERSDHLVVDLLEDDLLGPGKGVGEDVHEFVRVVLADGAIERGRRGEAMQPCILGIELIAVAGDLAQRGAKAGRPID